MRDDEDKGSPSRDGINFVAGTVQVRALLTGNKKKSIVQRKPFGYAVTRDIFPSEIQLCNNTMRVIAWAKL